MKRNCSNCLALSLIFAIAAIICVADVDATFTLNKPARLRWHYYRTKTNCTYAEQFVKHQVSLFYQNDKKLPAKLLKLLYSDCFVTGCDASILLDGPNSEKMAPQNSGLDGFIYIDKIKKVMEQRCPGVVSCADILNLAARDAVHLAGAPSYPVFTGRRDGFSSTAQSVDLPSPSISAQEALAYFESRGLNTLDMTTLLGAHSLGKTHCSYIMDRLYNYNNTRKPDPSIDKAFVTQLRKACPKSVKKGKYDPWAYLNSDSGPNYKFTNSYYQRVLAHKSVLGVDQQLLYDSDALEITQEFAADFENMRRAFTLAMYNMGNINVLTGSQGEIRQNCRYRNK